METQIKTYRCPITLTNTAKEKMRELGFDEQSFFLLEKSFRIYIEKYPQSADRIVTVALYVDNLSNKRFLEASKGKVIVLHCVVKPDRFIVTNVTNRPPHVSVQSNWRQPVNLSFTLSQKTNETFPLQLLDLIHNMQVAQESSKYVKKRIVSWEGYLKIQERTADIPDMITRYSRLIYNDDFSRVTLLGCQLNEKEWKLLKDLSVKLKGIDQDIGKVLKANQSSGTVEIELFGYMEEQARKQQLDKPPREVVFSNFATLSQVKRLRQGFKQLENGQAANPELERLLFENKPPVKEVKRKTNLKFHNRLNEFQQEAVIGAMSAEDLYVIQGPPGTGKTTVISEICLQNAKAGLRTLVASQSNLAVDNALGRLLANKDIRILRVGRTESIEEEGKKFIEENVGYYWKDHTLKEVTAQVEARKQREFEIEKEWLENEQIYEHLQHELKRVEVALEAKNRANNEYQELLLVITQHQKDLNETEQELKKAITNIEETEKSLQVLDSQIQKDKLFLSKVNIHSIQEELADCQQNISRLQASISLQNVEEEITEKEEAVEKATIAYNNAADKTEQLNGLIERIDKANKVDTLKWIILEQNLKRTLQVQEQIGKLEEIREKINQREKLKNYNDILNRAISYVEQLFERHNITINQIQHRMIITTSIEIDQFLSNLKSELKGNPLSTQRLISYLEGLYGRRLFIWRKAEQFKPFQQYVKLAHETLQDLKQEMLKQLYPLRNEYKESLKISESTKTEQTKLLRDLQSNYVQLNVYVEIIPNAKELLVKTKEKMQENQNMQDQYDQAKIRIDSNVKKREDFAEQLHVSEKNRIQAEENVRKLNLVLKEKKEACEPLLDVLSSEPEVEHENVLRRLASVSFTHESLKQEKQRLPLFQSIQGKWMSLLEEANEHDLNEIRKLYVEHANVIGTTCVASARKEFIENYPVFDVVIIDEVSKATPPELLLPMLKGKKIILVGDHHQLPPLLGNDTLEETLQEMTDENGDFEGKGELKQLLKESLFERLFKHLPSSNKTMLAIQYRMHENIMSTITQFYEQENDRLRCGLTDSDSDRDHLLESPQINRHNHLLWIDMPNEPPFFEERMKGGKSLYNPAELERISELLKEVDEATASAKKAGRMGIDKRKSIGVISFYGEQVKRIDRMIQQELRLPNLNIRTGTVDKFQGMEMDIIILSMVRNHNSTHDDIGFAKDYRRLNVALSRARELLVLIGSTKMFTERTKRKETRQMYTNVLYAVKQQQGLRSLKEVTANG